MIKKILILTALLIVTLNAFAQTNFLVYKSSNYAITYPENWRLDTNHSMGEDLILSSPSDEVNGQFNTNVNIVIQDLTDLNLDLEGFRKLSLKQLKKYVRSPEIFENAIIGNKENRIHGNLRYTALNSQAKLMTHQHYYIKDSIAYIISLSTLFEEYEKYKAVGMEIFKSFELQ